MSNAPDQAEQMQKTREFEFFIRVLADHLAGRQTEPPERLDWELFFRLAQAHQLAAVADVQCKNFLPEAYKAGFETAFSAAVFYHTNRLRDMKEIAKAFEAGQIRFFPVKGPSVARYYPVPALRTMVDCDIVVPDEDTDAAIEALRGIGFENVADAHNHAWTCRRNGRHFELHNRLIKEDDAFATAAQKAFFNGFMPYFKDGQLDWSFHFLFLLLHMRTHFFHAGVGIRQFMDLAVVIGRGPALRWDWIEARLEELELLRYAHVCYALIEAWFGVAAPVAYERPEPEVIWAITEKILNSGVFGYADGENLESFARNYLAGRRGPRWIGRFSYFLKAAFLRYSDLKYFPGCGYLDGRPYLLPVAWIHRFAVLLARKDKSMSARRVRDIFISEKELKKQQELLAMMGLK